MESSNNSAGRRAPDSRDAHGSLMCAVSACDTPAVRKLLSSNRPIVNFQDCERTTALMCAAMNRDSEPGALDIMGMLLGNGADMNTKDNCGRTALHFAAGNKNIASVGLLLSKGANPYLRNTAGLSASDVAKEVGAGAIAALLEKNMGPSTPELVRAIKTGNIHEARFQLEQGVNPNTDASGTPLLFVAVEKKDADMVQLLVSMGANPNALYGGQNLLDYTKFKHPYDWSFRDAIERIVESAAVPSSRDARSAARGIERARASPNNNPAPPSQRILAARREQREEAGRQHGLRKYGPGKMNVWVPGTKMLLR